MPYRDDSPNPYLFFALACAMTWSLAAPAAWAFMQQQTPSPLSLGLAGLSAFGPMLAALVLARGRFRDTFVRFWASPQWLVLGLGVPLLARTVALAGGNLLDPGADRWFYLPDAPERLAALVVFPIGEEFGWRGFAYPLLARAHGAVKGSLLLGVFWAIWHLAYSVVPGTGAFDVQGFASMFVLLPLYSVTLTWLFERSGRSLAVAIAFHAAAHLQHIELAPRTLAHTVVHLVIALGLALAAMRFLRRPDGERAASSA